jgi:hypothetical protein
MSLIVRRIPRRFVKAGTTTDKRRTHRGLEGSTGQFLDFDPRQFLHLPSLRRRASGPRFLHWLHVSAHRAVSERLRFTQVFAHRRTRLCRPGLLHVSSSIKDLDSYAMRAASNTSSTAAPYGGRVFELLREGQRVEFTAEESTKGPRRRRSTESKVILDTGPGPRRGRGFCSTVASPYLHSLHPHDCRS